MKRKNEIWMTPTGEIFLYVPWYSQLEFGKCPRERILSYARLKETYKIHLAFFEYSGFERLGYL